MPLFKRGSASALEEGQASTPTHGLGESQFRPSDNTSTNNAISDEPQALSPAEKSAQLPSLVAEKSTSSGSGSGSDVPRASREGEGSESGSAGSGSAEKAAAATSAAAGAGAGAQASSDPSVTHALSSKRVNTAGTARSGARSATSRHGEGLGGPGAGPPRRATMDSSAAGGREQGFQRSFTQLFVPDRPLAPAPTTLRSVRNILCFSWLNILLVFIPVSWALHFALENSSVKNKDVIVFVTAFLAIIPLAQLLSLGTEEIALRVGETLGGLMNATLGNAVELIVAIIALFNCELTIVQTSLIGSVLSNILLVLGMCFFAGGLRYSEQTFQVTAAQINSSLLVMAVITVILPAGFHATLGDLQDPQERADVLAFSRGTAVILLSIYLCYLWFTLSSHKHLFTGEEGEEEEPTLNTYSAVGLLIIATVLIGVTSEWLVSAINGVADAPGGPSRTWIGLILLPIVSNAAEHVTAVTVAVKDKLDLSMGVAVGSSIQISIFVIPLLVVIAWIANKPLSMLFDPFVAIFLFLAVLIVNSAIQDGKTNWLEGYLLMMVYVIAAVVFWYVNPPEDQLLFPDSLCSG